MNCGGYVSLKKFVNDAILTESDDFLSIHQRMQPKRHIRLIHASVGISTEITELIQCLQKSKFDKVNFMEENADILWYVAIACHELNLDFEQLVQSAHRAINVTEKNNNLIYKFKKTILLKSELQKRLNDIIVHSGTCLDIMKKTIFYSNKVFDETRYVENLTEVLRLVTSMLLLIGYDTEYACERVIHKLQKVRYKMGKFTAEEAIERDLEQERKSLENKPE